MCALLSKRMEYPIRVLENTLQLVRLNHTNNNIHNNNNSNDDDDDDNSSAANGGGSNKTGTEFMPSDYPGILDVDLTALTSEERLAFKVTVCILCCLSLCGNISTLGVNLSRKMRPFFRACLISLAISDLLNTIFSTTVYVAQFSTEYVQIWLLGNAMCSLVPFATTTAILACSMTLVVIALDRYFAVMEAFVSQWKPGHISGVLCMLIIWTIAIGIASPVFWIYHVISVYILTEVNIESGESVEQSSWQVEASKENFSYVLVKPEELVSMCVSDRKDVALYYVIVFSIIFVPCIVAFVWLNATIAKKIWIRRHKVPQTADNNNDQSTVGSETKPKRFLKSKQTRHPVSMDLNSMGNTKSTKISTITTGYTGSNDTRLNSNLSNTREQRHLRMVIVLILLIAVFILLRLPAWIFLLMRMYGSYTKPHDWIVYFTFGILNVTSCALNPLFYTFLHETIQYILCCKMKCNMRRRRVQRSIGECNCGGATSMSADASVLNFGCCACCGIFCGIFGMCPRSNISRCATSNTQELNVSDQKTSKSRPVSLERDEGVDCSDDSYDDDDDSEGYGDDGDGHRDHDRDENDYDTYKNDSENASVHRNKQIFTVFSVALVPLPVPVSVSGSVPVSVSVSALSSDLAFKSNEYEY